MRRLMALAAAAALMAACGEGGSPTTPRVESPADAFVDAVDSSTIAPSEEDPSRPLPPFPRRRDPDRLGDPGQQFPTCRRECSAVGRRRGST